MKDKKCIVLGVSGGIAAYKAAQCTSNLKKKGYDVHVIMTKNATEFITPLTFETLSGNRVSVDTFDRNFEYQVQHVSLAKQADVFVIVPATANVIAKIVHGLADDMLTTTFLASSCAKIICPAMNTGMLDNPVTQKNLELAESLGMKIVEGRSGLLACGDVGRGRMAEPDEVEEAIEEALCKEKPLQGLNVLISAGPTQEALDPVRFVSNYSSGKMGYALARVARNLGAQVTLVHGKTNLQDVSSVENIKIESASQMAQVILSRAQQQDIIIKAAAVADYTPLSVSEQKIKKQEGDLSIPLKRTTDILKALGEMKSPFQVLCGFAMETENLIENAQQKLLNKKADMIVANSLTEPNAGFSVDTNRVTLLTVNNVEELVVMSKMQVAEIILLRCEQLWKAKQED